MPDHAAKHLCNARDQYGNTVLHWAAKAASLGTSQYLLRIPYFDMYARNNAGSVALHWAATAESPPEEFSTHAQTPAPDMDAVSGENVGEAYDWYSGVVTDESPRPTNPVVDLLIERHLAGIQRTDALPANAPKTLEGFLSLRNRAGETPLHWAVEWQSTWSVRSLLYRGAPLAAEDGHRNTPLHKLYRDCHTDPRCVHIVSLLVTAGAPTKAANEYGREALEHFDTAAARPTVTSREQRRLQQAARGEAGAESSDSPAAAVLAGAPAELRPRQ
jgi:hypothetical protein